MVAVMLFVAGGVLAIQRGIDAIQHPHEITSFTPNYIVLGAAIVIEGFTFRVALQAFQRRCGGRAACGAASARPKTVPCWSFCSRTVRPCWAWCLPSSDWPLPRRPATRSGTGLPQSPSGFCWGSSRCYWPRRPSNCCSARRPAAAIGRPCGCRCCRCPKWKLSVGLLTMHMGPQEILVNLEVDLVDGLADHEVEQVIDQIESEIRKVLPGAANIFVELETRTNG